jgi:acylphosphatase
VSAREVVTALIARHVVASGRVQGVFFRDCARREAGLLGVMGWVRNRSDGSVEAHLEGPPDAVAQLVLWWRRGPPHATVDELLVTEAEPAGFDRFTVR